MKKIIILLSVFIITEAYSQVGINTSNPINKFHVDGNKDNPLSGNPNNTQQANDFSVTSAGQVGVGTISPKLNLDVRAADGSNSAIGIGYTTQTGTEAGIGALRYDFTKKCLEYSDGTVWSDCLAYEVSKVAVLARNDTNNSQAFTSNPSTPTAILNWTETLDNYNAFDATTGLFTAPKTGVYLVSFTSAFSYDNINTGTKIEDSWISSTGKTLKYIRTFPASIMSYGAAYCFGSIYLVQGETLRPYIWHNTGLTRYLRIPQTGDTGGRGFNNLSIVEQ